MQPNIFQRFPVSFEHQGRQYTGWLNPVTHTHPPVLFQVVLNGVFYGNLTFVFSWQMDARMEWSEILGYFAEAWWQ